MKEISDHEAVIENITAALLKLMEKKPFADITVTELCQKAGVGRVSFYRNYNSKQDILIDYLSRVTGEWWSQFTKSNPNEFYETFWHSLINEYRKNSSLLLLLEENNATYIIKDHIFRCCGPKSGDDDRTAYTRAMLSGLIYGLTEEWIHRGIKDEPDVPDIPMLFSNLEKDLPERKSIIYRREGESALKYYLAIDIGASSGRHIIGWKDGDGIRTEEVYRFPNGVREESGHLVWDMDALLKHVKAGIGKAKEKYGRIESLSVDTWGVDYVLLKGNEDVKPCYAYRDSRTEDVIDEVHGIVPFDKLYERTGTQFQSFNTIYQLYRDKKDGRLASVTDFLMIPEYLMYRLTGVKAKEYTNASTTGLLNAETGEYDKEIIRKLGLPEDLFTPLSKPGTTLGEYEGIKVVLSATHDTASAVEGIPMKDNSPYISSGTWSLLGVKTEKPITTLSSMKGNWSNEGGVGYNRYQKNIMGMWLVNRLRDELCPDLGFLDIVKLAEESTTEERVDASDPAFLAPRSMKEAFDNKTGNKLLSVGDYFRCACLSLAFCYAESLRELEENTGKKYDKLYIVGGGAKNGLVNRLTEEYSKRKVTALPIEATAYGNLKIQMEADK